MSKKEKILVIAEPDFTPISTVRRAVWLAQICDCELYLLFADAPDSTLGKGLFPSAQAKQIDAWIASEQRVMAEELADTARKAGIKVKTEVLIQRPLADAVLKRADKLNPRFVVKATQYHSDADRAIFVDTDWRLIRRCPYPLWLVKPHDMPEKPVIVCAVDPTHAHDKTGKLDQAIVDAGLSIASHTGGQVELLHTFETLAKIGDAAKKTFKPVKLPMKEIRTRMRKEHRALLDELAKKNSIGKKRVHQMPGRPHEILPAFARSENADVVVMGGLARWGLKRMILGSTAEKVMDHLPCDILVVRAG